MLQTYIKIMNFILIKLFLIYNMYTIIIYTIIFIILNVFYKKIIGVQGKYHDTM